LLAALVLLAPGAAVADAPQRTKLAVMDLRAERGMDPSLVRLLNEVLLASFQQQGQYETIGSSDIVAMLTLEEERIKLTGCADDACLAEIGGALGVDLLAAASAGRVGSLWVLTLKLVDVKRARVLARAVEEVEAAEEKLLAGVRRAVASVVDTRARVLDEEQGGAPMRRTTLAAWVLAAAGAAALVGGGVSGGLALSAEKDLEDVPQVDVGQRDDLTARADNGALAADVLFAVGGAAVVTALILFLLPDGDEAPAATLMPVDGGEVGAAAWRW
jgi:hypothetical protein